MPLEVPSVVFDRVSAHCSALPEVTLRSDSTAHAFEVRRRVFAYLLSVAGPDDVPVTMVVVDADADERRALAASGHPYFLPGSGARRLGVVLDDATDWDEVGELLVDSYRLVAPKQLSAQLDQ